jgi:hypothetical protein
MSSFKKFHARKVEEVQNRRQSFDEAKMFGAYPHSSRQPAAFHYYLTLLERFTPEASKAEILFEAVRSAYEEVVVPHRESMQESVKTITDDVYTMLFQAYAFKCAKSSTDETSEGYALASDESKAIADEFLSEFDSGSLTYAELVGKYENTVLNPNRDQDGE